LIDAISIINSAKRKATADEIKAIKKLIGECNKEEINRRGEVHINENISIKKGTVLMGAVLMGNLEIVNLILEKKDININVQVSIDTSGDSIKGLTALSLAIGRVAQEKNKETKIVESILKKKV